MTQPNAGRRSRYTNIGERERRVRLVLGGLVLAATLWIGSILVARDAAWGWRLLLFPLFYQGIRFFFDYRTGICPGKAELGQCRHEGWLTIFGDPIDDPDRVARIRTLSRWALLWSLLGATALTAGVMAL